jgi:eukaryotic-like serine/threonine-protein kinase
VRLIERGTILLGKYRVDSIIGRGGMGLVVKAWHLGLDEEVAIKMLRNDVAIADETIARFVREAQAAVKLKSEHIARIIDVGTFADGKPFLVMEFLEGQDIGQLLAERGRLQPSLAIDLIIQACEGLAEAHSLGIVHRDIKPTNLFLTSRPDGSLLLKILDFGISKSPAGAELSLTQTWSLLGSPAYMSPEQMRSARHVDARTDVWSLGAVLYEAIEGHLPFQAESFSEMCVMVAVDPPAPTSATPREIAPIIARCLAKDPADRYASVADLACDLACLAREPDKAQALVDRMYRMLRRGALRRTPFAGVPVVGVPTGQFSEAATPRTVLGIAPVPGAARPGVLRTASASPPEGVPVATPHPGSPTFDGLPTVPDVTPPFGSPPPRASAPEFASYTYSVPLPVPLGHQARFLRPGFELPRGASGMPRGAPALTMTHVIRRERGWLVSLIAAAVVLAAAAAVIVAMRPDHPASEGILIIPDSPTATLAPPTGR